MDATTPRRRISRVMQHCSGSASAFRYSLDSAESEGILTRAQREFYEENGYIVVKRLVPEAALARYNARFQQYCTGARPAPDNMTMMRDVELIRARGGAEAARAAMGEDNVTKLQHFHMDRELFAYSRLPEVVRYVRAFCGPNVKSVHTMLINKPPDLGKGTSRHPPHQDLWYFPFRPADRIVASWTAMQRITPANGCLFVKPGSHKGALLMHEYPNDGTVNKAYHGIQGFNTEAQGDTLTKLSMDPGDTVFFHPLLIHGSGRNRSGKFRKAISTHYASCGAPDACYMIETLGTIQDSLATEILEMAKSKAKGTPLEGLEITHAMIYRFLSQLVHGEENAEDDPPPGGGSEWL